MPVVATAGHVDHGKSTLVRVLTGRDPDRWEEEKRRGMTIDLGFAWMTTPSGREVSFVDVPGHRRFVGNMLAGVGPVDAALLVVAADEGWMPQTEEHLSILDLLGIDRGVVAITKTDLVDDVAPVATEVRRRLAGTPLERAPVVAVSAQTAAGIDELVGSLESVSPPEPGTGTRPRLWVDRSFTIQGAGTVVTGTLTGGSLAVGEFVELWPGGENLRIRGLQHNELPVTEIGPSHRVAVNLAAVDRKQIQRGAMLSLPGTFLPTTRILAKIDPARYETKRPEKGSFQLYLGTFSSQVTVHWLDSSLTSLAIMQLRFPVCVQTFDRFVIRDVGRGLVAAGGSVLDGDPPRHRGKAAMLGADLVEAGSAGPDRSATIMLAHRRRSGLSYLAALSGGGHPLVRVTGDGEAVSDAEADRLAAELVEVVKGFQANHPLEAGMSMTRVAEHLRVPPAIARRLVEADSSLTLSGGLVAEKKAARDDLDANQQWIEARRLLVKAGMSPPPLRELGLEGELLRALVRGGRLVRVSDDLAYLPEAIEQMTAIVKSNSGPFTVSEFRQQAGITRKHAVPFLEWSDREGLTMRNGDQRTPANPRTGQ
ncbi:MAG: selenocysteine-specific translation elongation factor [Actinomycetota bacterium]